MIAFLKKLLEPTTNAPESAMLLLNILGVKVSESTLRKEIEEHPDYPSLVSISDTLRNLKVENITVTFDVSKLDAIPTPFITQITGRKSQKDFFTVVKQVGDHSVLLSDPERRSWIHIPKTDFIKKYRGFALIAEPDNDAGERGFEQNVAVEKKQRIAQYLIAFCIPVITLLMGVILLVQEGTSVLLPISFSILTLTGCITGALLIWYELDQYNPALQQLCSAGKKVNCGAILNSKAAKIGGVSWSVIGFSYFAGELIFLLFSGLNNPAATFVAAWLSVLAIPYIFFSIFYQFKIAKQWCVLCLSVQAILLLQFLVALVGHWHTIKQLGAISATFVLSILTVFAIPFISTLLLVQAFQKAKENRRNRNDLQRLKHNPKIFEAMLTRQKAITESTDGLGIVLGNPTAVHKIIKVCNPYCGPCAKAHPLLEELLHSNPNVQVQIIFTATNLENDGRAIPVKHLMAIVESGNEDTVKLALNDWYLPEDKNYDVFAAKYPMNGELQRQANKIEQMDNWCEKIQITFTPTFFVNGYQLPSIYNASDLKYLLAV